MSSDSRVMQAVLSGGVPLPEHFEDYYRQFHAERPSATESGLAQFVDESGRGSYDRLADALDLTGARVLDLGCGDGALLERIIARAPGAKVSGIDLSDAEIARAAARLPAGNVGRLLTGNADALPFGDGGFDAVFSHMMLMLVPDVASILGEARRVLRSGGAFASLVPRMPGALDEIGELLRAIPRWIREHHPAYAPAFPGDPRIWQDDALVKLFESAGFQTVSFDDFTLARASDSKVLRTLVEQRYYIGSLPDTTLAHVRSKLSQWAGERTFTYRESMRIIVAR